MIRKIVAVFIVLALLITILKKWTWLLIGLVVAYFLIRWGADIFWWGKDSGKW